MYSDTEKVTEMPKLIPEEDVELFYVRMRELNYKILNGLIPYSVFIENVIEAERQVLEKYGYEVQK